MHTFELNHLLLNMVEDVLLDWIRRKIVTTYKKLFFSECKSKKSITEEEISKNIYNQQKYQIRQQQNNMKLK